MLSIMIPTRKERLGCFDFQYMGFWSFGVTLFRVHMIRSHCIHIKKYACASVCVCVSVSASASVLVSASVCVCFCVFVSSQANVSLSIMQGLIFSRLTLKGDPYYKGHLNEVPLLFCN